MARKSKYVSSVPEITKSRYTAGLYLRLSVEDGDDLECNSIGNQRKICMNFLAGQREIVFGKVYVDNGRTGMNYRRPGFQAMFADLEDGKINCVVVKDISRLGRNYIMTSEYVEKIFPAMDIRLVCVNDEFDSEDLASDRDSLLMPFKLIMNDTYVKDIAHKIQSSIQAKMHSGEFIPSAGSVPYGYLRAPQEGTYAIDEETAPVVRRIFELRRERTAFNQIARLLNRENVPSPGKLRYDRGMTTAEKYKNALWIRSTIRKITADPTYLGFRIHGKIKRDRLGEDKKKRPADEWQIIPNAHPAIIDQALFDKVQEVNKDELEKRATFEECAAPEQDFRKIFQGKVFCGDCGARMTARKYVARKRGKAPNSVVFNCGHYRDSNQQKCSNHYIRQETLMDKLRSFLDKQVQIAVDTERLNAEAQKNFRASAPDTLIAGLSCQRRNLEGKLDRILEDLVNGILDKDEYTQLRIEYLKQLSVVKAQEMDFREKSESQMEEQEQVKSWLTAIQSYQKAPIIDRRLVEILVDRILVFHDKSVRICLTYGDPYKLPASQVEAERGGKHCAG